MAVWGHVRSRAICFFPFSLARGTVTRMGRDYRLGERERVGPGPVGARPVCRSWYWRLRRLTCCRGIPRTRAISASFTPAAVRSATLKGRVRRQSRSSRLCAKRQAQRTEVTSVPVAAAALAMAVGSSTPSSHNRAMISTADILAASRTRFVWRTSSSSASAFFRNAAAISSTAFVFMAVRLHTNRLGGITEIRA